MCVRPAQLAKPLPADVAPNRAYAIRLSRNKWVNGTVLHYCLMQRNGWDWPDDQAEVVEWGFTTWADLGIGLRFVAISDETEAEIKIGRNQNGRSWSYVGTDILNPENRTDDCTMNFGWDLTTPWGHATALHEIGHTLGLEHEHQNPKSGIVWAEDKVYANLMATNGWDRATTFSNILAHLDVNAVDGSSWDPKSIMHYPFEPGLIQAPPPYDVEGIGENTVLSPADKSWAMSWYPASSAPRAIRPLEASRLPTDAGAQRDFEFVPDATRDYTVRTVGQSDSRIVIFEERDGELRHFDDADDSGTPGNADITSKFIKGHRYVIRVRVSFVPAGLEAALIIV